MEEEAKTDLLKLADKEISELIQAKEKADEYKMIVYAFSDLIFMFKIAYINTNLSKDNDWLFKLADKLLSCLPNKDESDSLLEIEDHKETPPIKEDKKTK